MGYQYNCCSSHAIFQPCFNVSEVWSTNAFSEISTPSAEQGFLAVEENHSVPKNNAALRQSH
jgi:hypothetical protein